MLHPSSTSSTTNHRFRFSLPSPPNPTTRKKRKTDQNMSSKPLLSFTNRAKLSLTRDTFEKTLHQASEKLASPKDSNFNQTHVLAIHFSSCSTGKKNAEKELLEIFNEGYGFGIQVCEIDEGKGWRMTPVSTLSFFFRAATTCEEV